MQTTGSILFYHFQKRNTSFSLPDIFKNNMLVVVVAAAVVLPPVSFLARMGSYSGPNLDCNTLKHNQSLMA